MNLPLHFDGHGLNDADGKRIATFVEDEKELARLGFGYALCAAPVAIMELLPLAEKGLRTMEGGDAVGDYERSLESLAYARDVISKYARGTL